MKNKIIIITLIATLVSFCSKPKHEFENGLSQSNDNLFSILDEYPGLKDSFSGLDPAIFNEKLDNALSKDIDVTTKFLPLFTKVINDPTKPLQTLLGRLGLLIRHIRSMNPTDFAALDSYLGKLNAKSSNIIADSFAIGGQLISYINSKYTPAQMENAVTDIVADLKLPSTVTTFKDIENILIKFVNKNPALVDALQLLISGVSQFSSHPTLGEGNRQILRNILAETGKLFEVKTPNGGLGLAEVIQKLVINLKTYFHSGAAFSANGSHSLTDLLFSPNATLGTQGMFSSLKNLMVDTEVKTANTYPLELLAQGLNKLAYDPYASPIEDSLYDMIRLNFDFQDRSTSPGQVNLLDHLMFTFTIANTYGFELTTTAEDTGESGAIANVSGPSSGRLLTLGDCLFSMGTVGTGSVGALILTDTIFKLLDDDPDVQRDGVAGPAMPNTPVLDILQGESRGDAISSAGVNEDRGTAMWVMGWIARALWKGYGPYYNPNNKDASGNYLNPDGSNYMNADGSNQKYKATWQTSSYLLDDGDLLEAGVGLGVTDGVAGSYTIPEIIQDNWDSPNRQCQTNEECMYKNFQWLLYEKRFVFIMPLNAPSYGVFATIIGNGIAGIANAKLTKPSGVNKYANNGLWVKETTTRIKPSWNSPGDLVNWSNIPADGLIHIEAFCNVKIGCSTPRFVNSGEALGFFAMMGEGHVLPDVIGQNLKPISKLGLMVNDESIASKDVMTHWSKRNKLLPVVGALIGNWYDQIDTPSTKSLYKELALLLEPLSYPMFFTELAPVSHLKARVKGPADWRATISGGAATVAEFKPDNSFKTILTLLSETNPNQADGILALLSQTKVLTNSMAMLQSLGGSAFDDGTSFTIGDKNTWGARRKIFTAISEIFKQIKETVQITDATKELDVTSSMTTLYNNIGTYGARDANLNHADWDIYRDLMDGLTAILSPSNSFNIQGQLGNMLDSFSVPVTLAESKALVKAVELLLIDTRTNTPLYEITDNITNIVPKLLEAFVGNYYEAIFMTSELMKPSGFLPYFMGNLGTTASSQQIFSDLDIFLNSDVMQQTTPGSFWSQISDVMTHTEILLKATSKQDPNEIKKVGDFYFDFGVLLTK